MAKLSTGAWLVHDLGLAASLGGTMFGRFALQPSLHKIGLPEERDLVSAEAWKRFSWINLVSHAAFAVPWLIGRTLVSSRDVSRKARGLAKTKDMLVLASLITGASSMLLGRWLANRGMQGRGAQAVNEGERFGHSEREIQRTRRLKHGVGLLGMLNMFATAGVGAITTMLALEGNHSARFAPMRRMLPAARSAPMRRMLPAVRHEGSWIRRKTC